MTTEAAAIEAAAPAFAALVESAFHLQDFVAGGDINVTDNTVLVSGNTIYLPPEPPPPKDQRRLDELRAYVQREVEQWLGAELGDGPLLRLNKQELSEVVGRRRRVLVDARAESRTLGTEEALGEVFVEQAGRFLLVLGEAGSGKSVVLRQLAHDLLARAEADPGEPLPVLLDLASWTDDGRSFGAWLASADGLRRSYRQVDVKQFRAWLHEGRLILLLDGLDEVPEEHRTACARALNVFLRGEGEAVPGGLAVCCRHREYLEIIREIGPLELGAAIYLQPLAESQVIDYLKEAGPHVAGFRSAWEADAGVRELSRNPLLLRTMSLAFERPAPDPTRPPRVRMLDAYVERVFERAEERAAHRTPWDAPPDAPEVEGVFESEPVSAEDEQGGLPFGRGEVVKRLGWLAARLREHALGTFYLEELQPSWLRRRRQFAYLVLSRSAGGLLLGGSAGALLLLGLGASGTLFGVGEAVGTWATVVGLSLAGGLLAAGLDARRLRASAPAVRSRLRRGIALAGLVAAMGFVGAALFETGGQRGAYGLLFGLLWGAVVAVVFEPGAAWRTQRHDVRLVEPLRWTWSGARRGALRGLGAGLLGGAVLGGVIAWGPVSEGVSGAAIAVVTGVGGGVLAAVVGSALGGLEHGTVRAMPRHNLGFRLSIRNAGFAGAVVGAAAAVVIGGLGLASGALSAWAALGLGGSGGLFCGLLAALRAGGLNAVYHLALRVLLHQSGDLPFGAARFFRFATDLSLVRSAGGGYAFAHRLFAEYFAEEADREGEAPVDRL